MTSTSDPDAKPEPVTERWVCAGIRVTRDGKRAVCWLDEHGDQLLFGERTADYVTGAAYDAQVTRQGEHVTLHGKPRFAADRDPDDTRTAAWEVRTHEAKTRLTAASRERNAKKQPAVDAALAPLQEIAGQLRTQYEIDAFTLYVTRALHSAYYSRLGRPARRTAHTGGQA